MVATGTGRTWMAGALVALAACSGGTTPPSQSTDATGVSPVDTGPCNGVTCDGAIPATTDAGADRGQSPAADAPAPADRQESPGGFMDAGAGEPPAACGACAAYGEPALLGRVESPSLNALSGMAVSWRNPGVLYVHNDRNVLEFYALNERGGVLGHFTLTGAGATGRDLEDMEVARCPAGTCVYLADIGNNIQPTRSELVIFRVSEPEVRPDRPATSPIALPFERFAFTYPDGGSGHNAESLIVDPGTGTVYIIDKRGPGQPSAVYKLPSLDPAKATMAIKVADLPVPTAGDQPATSASAHPCGAGFLLRTNNTLYEFRSPAGTSLEEAFRVAPMRVPVGMEVQGEAVAYAPDGRSYYTTSERPSGPMAPIHRVACR